MLWQVKISDKLKILGRLRVAAGVITRNVHVQPQRYTQPLTQALFCAPSCPPGHGLPAPIECMNLWWWPKLIRKSVLTHKKMFLFAIWPIVTRNWSFWNLTCWWTMFYIKSLFSVTNSNILRSWSLVMKFYLFQAPGLKSWNICLN